MLPQTSQKRIYRIILSLLLLVFVTLGIVILLFSDQSNLTSALSPLNDIAASKSAVPNRLASATSTPFQPLPTETITPTSTLTPTPTRTRKPTKTPSPLPTLTPTASDTPEGGLPLTASINGIYGYPQAHSLSCESRSASDWARYYGVDISEEEIQSSLPMAENPNRGFVGLVDGPTGNIPPNSYGVHAPPVAKALRAFGLSASAHTDYSFFELRQQLANGNPVIVWVIGNVWPGTAIIYTLPNGKEVSVAPFEHTAIVTGYDEYGVTLLDNNLVYWRNTEAFLESWSVLGNMAISME